MASLEDKLRGDKRENLIGDSDSEDQLEEQSPVVETPVPDGLPQVH